MRKKLTIASLVSLCAVPSLIPTQDASALPVFARKYGTSCYTCHSGFPQRNAFGEAFKNNGYRWPGGEDEDKTKQDQLKMGADGWKKTFPESPWPAEIPGYAPVAVFMSGNLYEYATSTENRSETPITAQKSQWGTSVMNSAAIYFAGTMGENLSAFAQYTGATSTAAGQLVWNFRPGLKVAFGSGTGFNDLNWGNATNFNVGFVSGLVPSFGTGAEIVYIPKEQVKLSAGIAQAGTAVTNSMADSKYFRAKYKIGGAGLLSGAGGTYGNEFVGLDNNITIGATAFSAAPGTATGNFLNNGAAERFVWETDITGSYGNFLGAVGYSRSTNLALDNYKAEVGYFLYPWLKGSVAYTGMKNAEVPTLAFKLTTHVRANAYLTATYTMQNKEWPLVSTTTNTANTFNVGGGFAF